MVEQVRTQLGEVSILVNNASSDVLPKPFSETTWEYFQQSLNVTLAGAKYFVLFEDKNPTGYFVILYNMGRH